MMNDIPKPPIERQWLRCPQCGAKTILYDNTANCSGGIYKMHAELQALI